MTIKVLETIDDYTFNCNGFSITIEKPIDIKTAKRKAREHFDAVGKKVVWKFY